MKLNKFKVSTVLYFKSGNSKKVDWIEERLVKKVKGESEEVTQPLTLDEADAFFQGKFKDWKDSGSTIVRKNAKGENSIIPFAEVEYATVSVSELVEVPAEVKDSITAPPPPPAPMERQVRNIQDHPAFKNN